MFNKVWLLRLGLLVVAFMLFWLKGNIFLDPDFGWHITTGQLIADSGIPKTDPFSYTMSSFPWVEHAWLSDYLMNIGYQRIGLSGLAVVFAVMAAAAIWVANGSKRLAWIEVPIFFGMGELLSVSGVRPQVSDWLFSAIVIYLLYQEKRWQKWRWMVLLVFVLWANLHGGFVIGLGVVGMAVVLKAWERRRWDWLDGLVVLGAVGATLVNPYGVRLWWEVWQTFSDGNLRWNIIEWQPFFMNVEFGYPMLMTLLGFLTVRYWRAIERWKLVVVGVLFLAGLASIRNIPISMLMAFALMRETMEKFYGEFKKDRVQLDRANSVYKILICVAAMIFVLEVWMSVRGMKTVENMYPVQAVEFLKGQPSSGRLFSEYDWGGYLIWKLPGEKLFVDGRMPVWRWESPDPAESNWAFTDYLKIEKGEYKPFFEQYGVRTVLLKTDTSSEQAGSLGVWISQILGLKNKEEITLNVRLIKDGWERIYADKVAEIYAER
jgi:hypothetical protein